MVVENRFQRLLDKRDCVYPQIPVCIPVPDAYIVNGDCRVLSSVQCTAADAPAAIAKSFVPRARLMVARSVENTVPSNSMTTSA